MYPRNAASPERIAVGAVVQIADGIVQTSGVAITYRAQGGAEAAGGGTLVHGASGVVYYTPTQAETNVTSFALIASKAACIPVAQTIVTTASSVPGNVILASATHTGAVIPTVSAVTGLTPGNLDVAVSTRMATYTQPSGFLAATFPTGTVANTTNITAGTLTTVTNLTNLPSIPANWLTAAGIAASALNGKGNWNINKTGYTLSQAFPTNFAAMSLTAGGLVTLAGVTHTGAVIPTVSAVTGLTAANLDAAVSSRMATYTQPTGFLAATFPAGTIANTTNVTAGTITTTTNLTNLPSIPTNWITSAGINAGALDGKGNWNIGKTNYSILAADKDVLVDLVWDEVLTGATHNVINSSGKRLRQSTQASIAFNGTIDGTPTTTVIPIDASASATTNFYKPALLVVESSFGNQFRRIESYNGTTKEVTVSPALATVPVNGDTVTIIPWASVRVSDIDPNVIDAASIAANALNGKGDWLTAGGYTAPDNAGVTAIKAKTDQLTFTKANELDANIQSVNEITVTGNGQPGTEWGP